MLPAKVHCPAARAVAGVGPDTSGIVCGVIALDRSKEKGFGMNPAQLAVAREGGTGDTFLTLKSDPSTVERFCCGGALPVMDARGHYARDSYTYCPVWQAEKQRLEDARNGLAGGGVAGPEPVAHFDEGRGGGPVPGTTQAADDPWAQARRDLDVLAPPAGR